MEEVGFLLGVKGGRTNRPFMAHRRHIDGTIRAIALTVFQAVTKTHLIMDLDIIMSLDGMTHSGIGIEAQNGIKWITKVVFPPMTGDGTDRIIQQDLPRIKYLAGAILVILTADNLTIQTTTDEITNTIKLIIQNRDRKVGIRMMKIDEDRQIQTRDSDLTKTLPLPSHDVSSFSFIYKIRIKNKTFRIFFQLSIFRFEMIESTSTVKQRKVDLPAEAPKKDVDEESTENTSPPGTPEEQQGLVSRFGSGLWNYSSVRYVRNYLVKKIPLEHRSWRSTSWVFSYLGHGKYCLFGNSCCCRRWVERHEMDWRSRRRCCWKRYWCSCWCSHQNPRSKGSWYATFSFISSHLQISFKVVLLVVLLGLLVVPLSVLSVLWQQLSEVPPCLLGEKLYPPSVLQ